MLTKREDVLSNVESKLSSSAHSVVNTLKAQNDAVTASLTSLVDQQRQHNMEMLRLARAVPDVTQSDSVSYFVLPFASSRIELLFMTSSAGEDKKPPC